MITAGIDIGTRFMKISILENKTLLAFLCTELKGNFHRLYKQKEK